MKAKKLLAVLLSLAMIMTMFPVVVFGADEPSDLLPTYQLTLVMTSTPVMAGWTPVTINAQKNPSEASSTMYSAESGYGFLSPISSLISRDRSSGNTYGANQMERDWVGSKDWKFQADVKPGTYNIIVYCTDMLAGTANNVDININGQDCASMNAVKVETNQGMTYALIENLTVTAENSSFLFHFTSSNSGYVNGIEISTRVPAARFSGQRDQSFCGGYLQGRIPPHSSLHCEGEAQRQHAAGCHHRRVETGQGVRS